MVLMQLKQGNHLPFVAYVYDGKLLVCLYGPDHFIKSIVSAPLLSSEYIYFLHGLLWYDHSSSQSCASSQLKA